MELRIDNESTAKKVVDCIEAIGFDKYGDTKELILRGIQLWEDDDLIDRCRDLMIFPDFKPASTVDVNTLVEGVANSQGWQMSYADSVGTATTGDVVITAGEDILKPPVANVKAVKKRGRPRKSFNQRNKSGRV